MPELRRGRNYERGKQIVPPPPWPPAWEVELAAVVAELGIDSPLTFTFWRALRRGMLWVSAEPESRAALFSESLDSDSFDISTAAAEPGLADAIQTFSSLPREPTAVSGLQLAEACALVLDWANERSMYRLAMHFAEMAAYADPDDPARCNVAGRACRRAGEFIRSHHWYEIAFRTAVRGRRRKFINTAVRALLGLGRLLQMQGKLVEARPFFVAAVRRARRRDRRSLAAEAHHDLFLLLAELGDFDAAEEHARGAVDYYGPKHPRFPYAVHDFAFLVLRRRYYRYALNLLEKLPPYFSQPAELALIWSTQAWAAAASGEEGMSYTAEERTLRLMGRAGEHTPAAYIHLAEAARAVSDWDKAERYAVASREAAIAWGNTALEQEADEIRTAIAERHNGLAPVEPEGFRIPALVRDFTIRLRRWKGP